MIVDPSECVVCLLLSWSLLWTARQSVDQCRETVEYCGQYDSRLKEGLRYLRSKIKDRHEIEKWRMYSFCNPQRGNVVRKVVGDGGYDDKEKDRSVMCARDSLERK